MAVAASSVITFGAGVSGALKVTVSPSPVSVGDNVQISIFAQERYSLVSPYQNADRLPAVGQQEFEEDVDVNDTATVTTNYPVAELVSATHLSPLINLKERQVIQTAGQPAKVDVVNSVVSLDGTNQAGTIRVRYKAYAPQSYQLSGFAVSGLYVIFFKKDSESKWTPLAFNVGSGQPDEKSQPSIVTVQAKDFCTDLPIEDVAVYINNQLKGLSDINGKLVVGLMPPGAHSIKMQGSGYIPTDADDLSNESFQI